jgi:hypothetical protein
MPVAILLLALLVGCSDRAAARGTAEAAQVAGIEVGKSSVAEAQAAIERRGVACVDASLMAAMRKAHAGKAMPAHLPDGHARYLNDPALAQARISCEDVPLEAIEPGRPAGVTARVLIVADRADAAVGLVALQRTHRDADAAADDARAMFAALERAFGRPDEHQGAVPAAGARLGRMQPVRRTWTRGGVVVEATAVDLGDTGISVSEERRVVYSSASTAR